jgi:hypothetical protein
MIGGHALGYRRRRPWLGMLIARRPPMVEVARLQTDGNPS